MEVSLMEKITQPMIWVRRVLCATGLLALLLTAHQSEAACSSTSNGTATTQSVLTGTYFADGRPVGSITPDCLRDLTASTFGSANNNINLKNLGLPTGGDDTAAINTILASALPSTFTGTGSISGLVLTVTAGAAPTIGTTLSGTNVTPGTFITSMGDVASTFNLSVTSTAASTTITYQPPSTVAVYAPCGTYNHATEIIITAVTLYGDGACTRFVSTNTSGTGHNAIELQGTRPQLKNLAVISNWSSPRSTQGYNDAVWVGPDAGIVAVDYLVENIIIHRAASAGIDLYNAYNGIVRFNKIYDTRADGITFQSHPTQAQHDVLILGNSAFNVGDDCFSVDQASSGALLYNIRIEGNHCTNTPARGLTLNGGSNVLAIGNVFDTPLAQGIFVGTDSGGFAKSDHFTVSDNICRNCGNPTYPGIQVIGQTGAQVTDIIVKNNQVTTTGMCMQIGAGGTGATAAGLLKGVTVEGNHCTGDSATSGSSTGISVSGVTNLTINNNYISNVFNDCIGGLASANLGDLIVEGNTCTRFGGNGGWVVDFQSSTFNYAVIRNNLELNDGTVPGGGMIILSGIPTAFIDGNAGDSGARGTSISGVTAGHFYDPFGKNTEYNNGIMVGGTKFTASGCTNSATVGVGTAGKFTLGAVSCSVVVTLNGATGMTATNGWACSPQDQTHPTALIVQSASTTTTATFAVPGTPAAISDVIAFACHPY